MTTLEHPRLSQPGTPVVGVTSTHVHTLLQSLGRAVQRASIYPPGHAAAALGLRPLVAALASVVVEGPVTVAVGKTRLLTSGSGRPPVEHRAAWLAARLFDRQIAALTMAPELDAVDLETFVLWLARPDGDQPAWPELSGLTLSRFDGNKLRFVEQRTDALETDDSERAWWALTAALRQTYAIADDHAALDPEHLGDEVRRALEAAEGMGISRLIEEIIHLHAGLAECDQDSRSTALLKLALLVEHLAPEVSGALFTITPEDSPAKVALVEDLLPLLSEPSLVDIATNVATAAAATRGPFARFLRKLADVATDHPIVNEALERRLADVGVPASLFDHETEDVEAEPVAADDPPASSGPADFIPAGYRMRLEALAQRPVGRAASTIDSEAFSHEVLDAHLTEVGVHACRRDPSSETTDAYLTRLAEILPNAVAREDTATVSAMAGLLIWLRASRVTLVGDGLAGAASLEGTFASPKMVAVTLAAIDAAEPGEAHTATEWLLAGGVRAIEAVLGAMKSSPGNASRLKWAAALMALDEEGFAKHVMPEVTRYPRLAEAFAYALGAVDPARAIVCAMTLATHEVPHVRRRAIGWLLSIPLGAGKARIVLPRALAERDPETARAALQFATRYPTAATCDALVEFLSAHAHLPFGWAYARAIRIVVSAGDPQGHVAASLRSRAFRFRRADRAVSVTIAGAIARLDSSEARAALRAWRWAPARFASIFTAPFLEPSHDH